MYKKNSIQSILVTMISVIYLITLTMVTMYLLLYGYAKFYPHTIQQLEIINYLFQPSYTGLFNVNYLSVAEKRHLFDVKYLIIQWENYTYLIIGISGFLFLFFRKLNNLQILKIASYIGLASIALLLSMIALSDFIIVFHYMHAMFFYENTWIFSQESKITQLFPLDYFYFFSVLYLGLLILVLSTFLLYEIMLNKYKG